MVAHAASTEWLARRGRLPDETRNYVKSITGHEPEKWIDSKEVDARGQSAAQCTLQRRRRSFARCQRHHGRRPARAADGEAGRGCAQIAAAKAAEEAKTAAGCCSRRQEVEARRNCWPRARAARTKVVVAVRDRRQDRAKLLQDHRPRDRQARQARLQAGGNQRRTTLIARSITTDLEASAPDRGALRRLWRLHNPVRLVETRRDRILP